MGRRTVLTLAAACVAFGARLAQAAPFPVPVLTPPSGPMTVFHLGHSLVGPDMPHMLQQLAPKGHQWHSQRGSGTALKEHWEPDLPIRDFDKVNTPPTYRDARAAAQSGDYDAFVLTEMVELRDAIRYFGSAKYLRRWADLIRDHSPRTRIYLYETWHPLDDPDGWLQRIDADLDRLWLGKVLGSDTRRNPTSPVYLIPAGQAMAAVARAAEAGDLPGITTRDALFARTDSGELDMIHMGDLGAYVVALTHYAVLYQNSPVGLPHRLTRADGSAADAFSDAAAAKVQAIVWQVVMQQPRTGVTQ